MRVAGEQHKRLYDKRARPLAGIAIFENKLFWRGAKNKVEGGPNIVVANHPGAHKDIGVLISLYTRQLFFTANKELFSYEEMNMLAEKYLGLWFRKAGPGVKANIMFFLKPFTHIAVRYISSRIARVGTIPVDIRGGDNSEAKRVMEQYLLEDKAVVLLQYNNRHAPTKYDPLNKEIHEFRYGAPSLAYKMFIKHGVNVPVTPISLEGTYHPFRPFGKVKVNIGEPMYITDYLDVAEPVAAFKEALEQRVVELYNEFKRA